MSDTLKFKCPGCGTGYNSKLAAAGTSVTCPKCRETIHIPKPAARDFEDDPEPPRKRNWNPEIVKRGTSESIARAFFILVFLAMFIGGCASAHFNSTARATAPGSEMLNIGLLNERTSQVMISCATCISGAIFLAAWYVGGKITHR